MGDALKKEVKEKNQPDDKSILNTGANSQAIFRCLGMFGNYSYLELFLYFLQNKINIFLMKILTSLANSNTKKVVKFTNLIQ
jgi:hypothetical protein